MVTFDGQRWIVDECRLSVSFPLTPHTLPEAWWTLEARAHPASENCSRNESDGGLHLCIEPIFVPLKHWRELTDLELRVDAAWQDAHEFVNEDGEVQSTEAEARWWPDRSVNMAHYWIADDFSLRFGSWDSGRLICELEAAMEREEDYYSDTPASLSTTMSRPKQRVTELLLMAQADLTTCEVEVPADTRDPVEWSRAKLARDIGLRDFSDIRVRKLGLAGDDRAPLRSCSYKVTLQPKLRE